VFRMGGVKEGPVTTGLYFQDRGAHHSHLMEYTSNVCFDFDFGAKEFPLGMAWLAAFVLCVAQFQTDLAFVECRGHWIRCFLSILLFFRC